MCRSCLCLVVALCEVLARLIGSQVVAPQRSVLDVLVLAPFAVSVTHVDGFSVGMGFAAALSCPVLPVMLLP